MGAVTAPGAHTATAINAIALERDLRRELSGEVRFDAGARALYATDASNYRHVPIGVVVPRSVDDVVAAVATCRRHGAPLTARGGGTSLAGQTCNVAVILDFSKHVNRVLEIDPTARRARVEPGANLDALRAAAAPHGLTFGPDPATHDRNTLGGMIGNDSCGVHSMLAELHGPGPTTRDSVETLDVLTYRGERLHVGATPDDALAGAVEAGGAVGQLYAGLRDLRDHFADEIRRRRPRIPRCVSGYHLDALLPENGFHLARALVGSEGTCATVLEAGLTLIPSRAARALLVLGYPSVYEAADHIPEIREHRPVGLEGIDDRLIGFLRRKSMRAPSIAALPDGGGWLLVEFGAEQRENALEDARRLMQQLRGGDAAPTMELFDDPEREQALWEIRESALGATAHVPGQRESHPGWEDSAVPPERLGEYLRRFRKLLDRFGYDCSLYGHFGQGCVHCRIDFELRTRAGVERYRHFVDEAADLVVELGGSLSGEHGDGQSRAALLPKMYGHRLVQAFHEFKALWDPDGRMNPGKVVDADPPETHLRKGPEYAPRTPATVMAFPDDGGSFAGAAARCVGVGLCRRTGGGVMCPSYMATREEKHSTRGRARLLFEMMSGELLEDGWRSEPVREALELCLACKGCREECPVHVDMAAYKAEFMYHHYARRLRPRAAYSMGWIYWWARLASHVPRLANAAAETPPFGAMLKWAAGVSQQRDLPRFAPETFRRWFARQPRQPVPEAADRRVLLWPDTFTNFLQPRVARAGVRVLRDAGCTVSIPARPLCCGRPLYDWGMLDAARRLWRQTLDTLRPAIRAGVPVIGLEPSCVAAFRDELGQLLPHDEDARRLAQQTFLLSEWLERIGYRPPRLEARALVQRHCHHRAVLGTDAESALLERIGVDAELLDSGCCGMAGAFGFERAHYDVSMACGERVLLPAVRRADAKTRIVADGFSCRTQIAQGTQRGAVHVAELLCEALDAAGPDRSPTL
ncbi:MAG TPA: FAD-linked oxidase C-terminal domain-containing protein [Myxococcota bacterium]|nr:FAD-linked oxidase C-terminal domain-containing protein [Myxococcota bacterium]